MKIRSVTVSLISHAETLAVLARRGATPGQLDLHREMQEQEEFTSYMITITDTDDESQAFGMTISRQGDEYSGFLMDMDDPRTLDHAIINKTIEAVLGYGIGATVAAFFESDADPGLAQDT